MTKQMTFIDRVRVPIRKKNFCLKTDSTQSWRITF